MASLHVLLVPEKNATYTDSLTLECCLHLLAKPLLGSFQCCDLSPTCEAHRTLGPESPLFLSGLLFLHPRLMESLLKSPNPRA